MSQHFTTKVRFVWLDVCVFAPISQLGPRLETITITIIITNTPLKFWLHRSNVIYDIILITQQHELRLQSDVWTVGNCTRLELMSSPWLGTGGGVDAGLSLVLLLAIGQRAAVDFWCPIKWSFLRRTRRVKAANTQTHVVVFAERRLQFDTSFTKNRHTWIYFTFKATDDLNPDKPENTAAGVNLYFIQSAENMSNVRFRNHSCF